MKRFYTAVLTFGLLLSVWNLSAQCSYSPTCTVSTGAALDSAIDGGCKDVTLSGNGTFDLTGTGVNLVGVRIKYSGNPTLILDGTTSVSNCTNFSGTSASAEVTIMLSGGGSQTFKKNTDPSLGQLNDAIATGNAGTLDGAITILPVTLQSYSVTITKTGVDLTWTTLDETDNEFFTLERSNDGRVFTELAEIRGRGTTASTTEYRWTDVAPRAGNNFYRLSQTDFDGTHTVLGVVSVNWTGSRVSVTPNPVNVGSTIVLDLDGEVAGGRAELISFDGRRVVSIQLNGAEGLQAQLPLDLPRGLYLLRLPNAPELAPMKLIIK